MQISTISVSNLRGLKSVEVDIDSLTTLIGSNNSGKSTILLAVELFFDAAPKLNPEDFTVGSDDEPIEITIKFCNLTPAEGATFGSATIDGELQVTRMLSLDDPDTGQYSVTANINPAFSEVRNESNGNKRRSLYKTLRDTYPDLGDIQKHTEIDDRLIAWEVAHPEELQRGKIRGFFGAPNVANGKLKKKTNAHLVPAVLDAGEEASDKKSPILSLLSTIAKQTLENRQEIADFLEESNQRFADLANPENIPALSGISETLTQNVSQFYSDSALEAQWDLGEGIIVNYPSPNIVVDHGGITTALERVGHGLQRAALFSIVKFLAEAAPNEPAEHQGVAEFDEPASDIILLIEEPEIYQHPSKQIAIFEALKELTQAFNVQTGIRVQILYTTHSEKFIRMPDFEKARIIRRTQEAGVITNFAKCLKISTCSEAFAGFLEPPPAAPMANEAFIAKLHIFTREVCEGFFADKVILTEGITDKAIMEAAYNLRGTDIFGDSIAIISAEGKNKLDKPGYIFSRLGIPTHLIYDNDKLKPPNKQKPKTNILLQKICDVKEPVEWPEGCFQRFTAIEGDLESYLVGILGEKYQALFDDVSNDYGLSYDEIKKTPAALATVFKAANDIGIEFPLFDEIIAQAEQLN